MRFDRIFTIFKKEISELFRDKKTIFVMFGLPLILYPILIIGISFVVSGMMNSRATNTYTVAVDKSVEDAALNQLILEHGEDDAILEVVDISGNYETAIASGEIACYLSLSDENANEYVIYFNSSDTKSDYACSVLEDKLDEYKESITKDLFIQNGLDIDTYLNPISINKHNLVSSEESIGSFLGTIVPLLLITGVFIGVMTPAVDATAGEKERGTQETIMTFPISGKELITGKFLAVSFTGALSAILYLICIGILAGYITMTEGLAGGETTSFSISAFGPGVVVVFISVIAFSLFLGALIMCICSFAKTSKEASSYISPLMMVVMLVAYLGFLDVKLTTTLSIVPILNIVLLIKSIMNFEYELVAIIIVLLSNIAYAAIAIHVLGSLYTSERILFGESTGSLLERRSSREKGSLPTWSDGVLILAIVFVLYVYGASILQLKYGIIGVGLTQIILIGTTLIACWYGRTDFKAVYSIKKLNILQILSIILTSFGTYFLGVIVLGLLSNFMGDQPEIVNNAFSDLFNEQSFVVTWLIIALTPAICEESLFRGYFFSSLKGKLKPWQYILISSVVFGIYHLNLPQGVYATLLGIVLGLVVYMTGSIFASAIIHFICNSMTVFISLKEDTMVKILPFLNAEGVLPTVIIAIISALVLALGLFLLKKSTKTEA